MRRRGPARDHGYVLLPIVLAVALVGAIAFLLNREGAIQVEMTTRELEADVARFVAAAGFHHALWVVRKAGCGADGSPPDLPSRPFGVHSYSADVTSDAPGEVTIASTGVLASGLQRTVTRAGIPLSAVSSTDVVQPGSAAGKDTYLDYGQQASNFAGHAQLLVSNKTNSRDHALLQFDLSGLSPNVEVTEATLELNLEGIGSANTGSVFVHRVTRSWSESQATWLDSESGLPWLIPGGDHAAEPSASAGVDATVPGATEWNLTDLVSAWIEGSRPNYGLLLKASSGLNHVKFTSSDAADPALYPKLTVIYRCPCGTDCSVGYYRDEFTQRTCDESIDYSGSDGTEDWSPTPWNEVGESNGSCAGEVRVMADLGEITIRFAGDQRGAERRADLSGFSRARLSFDYRRQNLKNAAEYLTVEVSDDDGSNWTEISRIPGPGTDSEYQSKELDISAFASSASAIRFVANALGGAGSNFSAVFVDNVQIDPELVMGEAPFNVTLNPVADTRIDENWGSANHGGDDELRIGLDAGEKQYRSLLRFDLSSVPASASVISATLRLYVSSNFGNKDVTVGAYKVTADWDEGTATWDNTGGGVYDPAELASAVMPNATGWNQLPLPTGLIHEWRDGVPTPNYGLILIPVGGTRKNNHVDPASREHATPAWHPQLVIEYTLP